MHHAHCFVQEILNVVFAVSLCVEHMPRGRLARIDMTSPHDANAFGGRITTGAHPPTESPRQCQQHGNMTGVMVPVADSDYGSDIPVSALSDYGSDIDLDDVEEDAIWGPHLIRLATSAPVQVTYRGTEIVAQVNHVAARTGLQDTPGKEHVGQSNLLVARSPRLEFEYDARSRGAFSGMSHASRGIKPCNLPI